MLKKFISDRITARIEYVSSRIPARKEHNRLASIEEVADGFKFGVSEREVVLGREVAGVFLSLHLDASVGGLARAGS